MKQIVIVTRCINHCSLFSTTMDGMQCNHPYFDDKDAYENMIITNREGMNGIPDKCPLRKSALEIEYKLTNNTLLGRDG